MLSELSDKLLDYCAADFRIDRRSVSSEEMGEFYYAMRKARGVEEMGRGVDKARERLSALLESYNRFLADADAYRLGGKSDPERMRLLQSEHDEVKRNALV